jgi:hypothetical protein
MSRREGSHAATHQNLILGYGILRRIFDDNANHPRVVFRPCVKALYQIADFHAAFTIS